MRTLWTFLLGVFASSSPLAAQAQLTTEIVPDLGFEPSMTSFARSGDEDFSIAAQTVESLPGVAFRRREDGVWSAPRRFFVDPLSSGLEPTVLVVEEEVFLCWVERTTRNGTTTDTLYFDTSYDEGRTWSGPRPMDPPSTASASRLEAYRAVATEVGSSVTVTVVAQWEDHGSGSQELTLHRSTNGGRAFEPGRRLANAMGTASRVRAFEVARGGNDDYVAWIGEPQGSPAGVANVYLARIPSGATTGASERALSPLPFTSVDRDLSLVASGSRLALAWLQRDVTRGDELRVATSNDRGSTFSLLPRLGVPAADVDRPSVQLHASGDGVRVVWADDRLGVDHVYGASVSASTQLSEPGTLLLPVPADEPLLIGDGERFSLLTTRVPGAAVGILSTDGGLSFGLPFLLAISAPGESATLTDTSLDGVEGVAALSWELRGGSATRQRVAFVRARSVTMDVQASGADFEVTFGVEGFTVQEDGAPFQVLLAAELGWTYLPGIDRWIGLQRDPLLELSLVTPLGGTLDSAGRGRTPKLFLPGSLRGFSPCFAALVLTPQGRIATTNVGRGTIR